MYLSYNGVHLSVVRPLAVDRQAVYDPTGKDYLGTKWSISVIAIYTPDVMKFPETGGREASAGEQFFVTAGNPTAPPVERGTVKPSQLPDPLTPFPAQPGQGPSQGKIDPDYRKHQLVFNSPVWTDAALRHKLMQPRRRLRLWFNSALDPEKFPGTDKGHDGEQLWLESPGMLPGTTKPAVCDLDNGPKPTVHSVQDIFGDGRLFLVAFAVETLVNDCTKGVGESNALYGSPLLSHQWTASLSYDEQYLCTRTIQGMAIFRADVIQTFLKEPDDFRLQLLPPIPASCKRMIDELTLMPDGYTYTYTVRDIEQAITYLDYPLEEDRVTPKKGFPARNVTVFDVEVERSFEQAGAKTILPAVTGLAQQSLWLSESLEKASAEKEGDNWLMGGMKWMGRQVSLPAGIMLAGANFMNEALPTFTETITVTVAGNRFSAMRNLQYLAFAAAFGQVTTPLGGNLIKAAEKSLQALVPGSGIAGAIANQLSGFVDIGKVWDTVKEGALRAIPTASVYNIKFSPTRKQLQFTLVTSYGGLVDWITGGTAGGFRAITAPLLDEVIGSDWPQSAKNNYMYSGAELVDLLNPDPNAQRHLPDMREFGVVGERLASYDDSIGYGPPEFTSRRSGKWIQGTHLTNLVAQKLMGECPRIPRFDYDAKLSPRRTFRDIDLTVIDNQILPKESSEETEIDLEGEQGEQEEELVGGDIEDFLLP